MSTIVDKLLKGDRLALSRCITLVENQSEKLPDIMSQIHAKLGKAITIGITGPPGSGKSTLVNRLIAQGRQADKKIGVIAIDPSSPFTGGALLGDRIRMQDHASDKNVFIRSLATRGAHGGVSRATRDVVRLMDASGMDWILIETVGVGQTELDIMEISHSTVVVLTPESGDTIQTMKAGLLEAADIFVINKGDREGADKILHELRAMIHLSPLSDSWEIPVLKIQATHDVGLSELVTTLKEHQNFLKSSTEQESKLKLLRQAELEEILQEQFRQWFQKKLPQLSDTQEICTKVANDEMSPYEAAYKIFPKLIK